MIKFNSNNPPSFVRQEVLTDFPNPSGLTYGFFVDTKDGVDRIVDGDYFDELSLTLYKSSEMTTILKNLIHEAIGKDVVRDLYRVLNNQNLTQAQEGDLLNRIFPVLATLGDGFIRGARVIANNLAIAGQLTQTRKDYLISKIDEAINNL